MYPNIHPFDILSTLDGKPEPQTVTSVDIRKAIAVMDATNCTAPGDERFQALNVLKAGLDTITPEDYLNAFFMHVNQPSAEEMAAIYERFPAFTWYDHAFDKVIEGVRNTVVEPGQVILWFVYNLGYIVKTATCCFSIDLHHRRALELVPLLDFCLVTHNHEDHYTRVFLRAMNHARKLIVSNFYPNDGRSATDGEAGFSALPQRMLKYKDITITTYQSDHNPKLRGFMMPAEIVCGEEPGACVIFTSGDTAFEQQLHRTSEKIDYYLVHPYCYLNPVKAADILQPRLTLVSHLEELHHTVKNARWTWRQGYDAARRLWEAGHDAVVPCWGDQIIWSNTRTWSTSK